LTRLRAAACLAALLVTAGAASASALNLSGTWSATYHCEAGGCAGGDFPATDTLTQAEGSSLVTGTNGTESISGTLSGSAFSYHSSVGGYSAEGTLTISPDGGSWSGAVHDSNGTSGTYTAARAAPASTAPELSVSADLTTVSGQVLVRLPGSRGFMPLPALTSIPFGAAVDATHGRVVVTTAGPHGGIQTGEFFKGEFVLTQARNGLAAAALTGGSYAACPTARERAHRARVSARRVSGKHVVRKLWANAHGGFSTKGNYAAGAALGTEWVTEDLCEGTLIRVTRDRVAVTSLVRHVRAVTVRAGHSLLVKAP
jgi:hypothetical protein